MAIWPNNPLLAKGVFLPLLLDKALGDVRRFLRQLRIKPIDLLLIVVIQTLLRKSPMLLLAELSHPDGKHRGRVL